MVSCPTPGQENTISVITAPPSSVPSCSPRMVITGRVAFFMAWWVIT